MSADALRTPASDRRAARIASVLIAAVALVLAACGRDATPSAQASPALPATASESQRDGTADRAAATYPAPRGIDPNDPAMVLSDDDPCTAPCAKRDVVYGSATSVLAPGAPATSLALDLYRSGRTPKSNAPVVVLLHGGGFVTGDRTQMRTVAEQIANAGFLVASISYRLVPGARNNGAPLASDRDIVIAAAEATEDTQRAMRFIRRHAGEFGATRDRERYAVGGYSAGAITAMQVALRGGDRSTPASRRWKVGAGFAISGFECGSWTRRYGCKGAYDRDDPPIEMFHGRDDSIVSADWARGTCDAAESRGGGCRSFFYPDQDHIWPSGLIFGGSDRLSRAHPPVVPTVITFLRRTIAAG